MASPLVIPFFTWLISLLGTRLALMLLSDFGIMDVPSARSNHTSPVPRGGGIAMVISALLFLASIGMNGSVLLAAVLLAVVSFADDLKSLPVSVRLLVQVVAVAIAASALPDHVFPAFVPHLCEGVFIALLWIWFINLTNFMDGIDGITSMQTILVSVGICLVCESVPSLPRVLAQEAIIIAVAALGFYWFNGWPAKVFMGDVGSITLGFLSGYMLLTLAMNGQWIPALILPAYYLSDATCTLVKRFLHGEKVWQAHSLHAYQQAVRSGLSHRAVVCRISGLNVLLVMLAMVATVSMMAAVAMLIIAYGLTACLIRSFTGHYANFPG